MRNESIAKVLKEYRKRNRYSVNDVAILLQDYSMSVAPKTIYGWESGQAQPSADMLLTLCEIYHIPNILTAFGYEPSSDETVLLSAHESNLILSYRNHPELQPAIDILLNCKPPKR